MKKIFALALAAVMAAGMTTVAFADVVPSFTADDGKHWLVDVNDDGLFDATATGEDKEYKVDSVAEGGHEVAVLLYVNATADWIQDKDDVDRYKIAADWDDKDVKPESKPAIERVKIKDANGTRYVYAVVFTLPEAPATKGADLMGDITLYKTTEDKKNGNNIFAVNITVGGVTHYLENSEDLTSDVTVVNFRNVDDAYITFGEDFEFEVNVTGQSKLNLAWNTDFDPEFADKYDYANIDFITFEKTPRFNKIGTAYIYADEDAYIYEVTDEGAKAIKGLEWDEDYEAWTFKTRTLTSYAISDVELDEQTVVVDDDDNKTDGGKENPDTGR